MTFSKTRKLLIGFAAIVLVGVAVVWIRSGPAPLALSFLYLTNSPSGRIEGVFRIDNHLAESATVAGGLFQLESRHGLAAHPTDVTADVDLSPLPTGGSTTFQLAVPTTGNRYRLILVCVPDSRVPLLAKRSSVRGRIYSVLIHSPLPGRFKAFVTGMRVAVSPCFQSPQGKS